MVESERDRKSQIFSVTARQSAFLTNLLLILNLVGIIIIILLLLLWWPWYWGHGKGVWVSGVDGTGKAVPGAGGDVIINAACCHGGTTTPRECSKPEWSCEKECKDRYPNDVKQAEECIRLKCQKQPDTTCEESCKQTTQGDYIAFLNCVQKQCPPPEDCKQYCATLFPDGGTYYNQCTRQMCTPEQQPSCEQSCEQRYEGNSVMYSECLRLECKPTGDNCRKNCWDRYKNYQNVFEQCVQNECTTKDCRDSDGYNLAVVGSVRSDSESHTDSCYDSTTVTEWTCEDGKPVERREPCTGRCQNGACVPTTTTGKCEEYCKMLYGSPDMEQYYQQCVQQRQCPV